MIPGGNSEFRGQVNSERYSSPDPWNTCKRALLIERRQNLYSSLENGIQYSKRLPRKQLDMHRKALWNKWKFG